MKTNGWLMVLAVLLALGTPALGKGRGRGRGRPPATKTPTTPPPGAEQVPLAPEDPAAARPGRSPGKAPGRGEEDESALKRGERVEFDGRLIEGQTAASGAIYLFERLPSELRSMVRERQSYQREVLETLYPNGQAPTGEKERDKERVDKPGPERPAR